MENHKHFPNPSNSSIQNPPITHANQGKKAMENFEELVFKLAETHQNNPLNPATKTLLQCRLNQFASEYKTPDHPPYSSMIEMALGELNEKKGSSVESISQHIKRKYNNLPFAHSVLLNHHLEKLSETGEIVVTCDKRYGLPGRLKLTTRRRRRRKWRYDSERIMYYIRKQKLRNLRKREEDKFKYDEIEQRVTENGANKLDQTKLDTTDVLLQCDSKQTVQPTKRRRGRPPKARPIVTNA